MKTLRRGLAVALAVVVVAAVAAIFWLRTSLPQTDGTIRVAGLGAPVEVLRDQNGVPHITAQSDDDAAFALGFVHAQDRLWQMETMRLAGAGRLAEVLGPDALRSDRFVRTLGLYRLAEEGFAALAPEVRRTLEAYSDGVNAFVDNHAGALPPEFVLLGHNPARWRPADSLAWGRLMAIRLADNWQTEALRTRLASRLTQKQIDEMWPTDTPPRQAALPAPPAAAALAGLLLDAVPPELGPVTASNIWAIAGTRTASGKPLLANDPHLGFQIPESWYLVRIEAPGLSVAGATIPGVPFVLLGHNDRIAWGFATTHSDTQDLFVEELDPEDPKRYLTPDGPKPFETRRETIAVRGSDPVALDVRITRHGPVVVDLSSGNEATSPPSMLALATPVLRADDPTAEAVWRVDRARSWDEFEAALRMFHTPQQNIVYADVDGHIAMISPGLVPVRGAGDGLVPAPGWTGEYDWTGFLPFEALPRSVDPEAGFVANANNRPMPETYPHFLGRYWHPSFRADRIRALIEANPKHTPDTMAAMQADVVSNAARALLPLMLDIAPADPRARQALELLRGWDGAMDAARPEPLIFNAWLRALVRRIAADEIGLLFRNWWDLHPDFVQFALTRGRGWCDDVTTTTVETCRDRLEASLADALAEIAAADGSDRESWRWGDVHKAVFRHMPFTFVPVLRELFDLVVEAPGGADTIDRGEMAIAGDTPYADVHGPGMRAIYDLAALDRSRFVVATGQSGNVFSSHYADLNALWREGRTVTIERDREIVRRTAEGALVLAPRPAAP